jgi:hypothetical protein
MLFWVFFFWQSHSLLFGQPNITRVEYYFDTDPGYGNAISIPLSPSPSVDASFTLNVGNITPGLHVVGVRSRDANGAWSFDEKWLVLKSASAAAVPNITYAEWYTDTDPGYGKATGIPITPNAEIINLSFTNSNLAGLSPGLHTIGVRTRAANGAWSFDERWLILKPASPVVAGNIQQIEYYIDNDPGYGKAIPVTFVPATQFDFKPFFVNITGLSAGKHKVFYRSKDTNGAWSFDDSLVFTINAPVSSPTIVVNSIEFTPVCKGGAFKIGFQVSGAYNPGNQFVAELSDPNGSFTNPTLLGSVVGTGSGLMNCVITNDAENGSAYKIRLRSTSPAITGLPSGKNITVNKYFIGRDTFSIVVCAADRANITGFYNPASSTITYSLANPSSAPIGVHSVFAVSSIGCRDTALVEVKRDLATWTGVINSDWHNPGNWSTGKVPNDSTHVIVPASASNPCHVSTNDGRAASLQVRANAIPLQLLNARKLTITARCPTLPQ